MDSPSLSALAREVIADGRNELFFSAASGWDIKAQLGRLDFPETPLEFVSEQLALNHIFSLPVLMSHALRVYNLPLHHNDPFAAFSLPRLRWSTWPS